MLALLAALKPGHAILLVEHDMDAVFRVADRITVMVNGAVHRERRPGRRPHERRRADRLPRRDRRAAGRGDHRLMRIAGYRAAALDETPESAMSALIEAHDLHAHYGESHVLRGVSLAIGAGESIGLLGRNGMGKTTLIRTLLGHVRASARHGARARARLHARARRTGSRAWASPTCPKAAASSRISRVRENLLLAARRARDGRPRLDARARARHVSAPRGAPGSTAASSCRAASSRCSRSAAR